MNTQLPSGDELNETPHLKSLIKKEPYKAPDHYFDSLSANIQDKIAKPQNRFYAVLNRPAYILATVLIIFIGSGIYFYSTKENIKPQTAEVSCTYDDVIESGYYAELDETSLAEKVIATTPANKDDDQAIEDYLINNSDESLLTNQF